ncbi:MAG: DUF2274 domain-containing protein [Altererythrobacter sp.]|mgnify:CR=1 FL=1|nr:DUF2274 domain-containing protein [Altererythrobacter sp.]
MTGLKLAALPDDKPVKLTIELPAALFADLTAYGAILGKASDPPAAIEPARLIVPMLQRFIASDRGFAKARRDVTAGSRPSGG